MKKIILMLVILSFFVLFGCTNNEQNDSNVVVDNNLNKNDGGLVQDELENSNDVSNNLFSEMLSGAPNHYVNYDMTSSQGKIELKQWIKGDKLRQDTTFEEFNTKTFFVENKVIICNNASGEEMCFEQIGATPISTGVETAKENISSWENKMTTLPSKIIAGVNTTCFKVVDADASYSYCFSKESVPLFVETIVGEEIITMTAKEYSINVEDNVFILPEAQQLPTFPTE